MEIIILTIRRNADRLNFLVNRLKSLSLDYTIIEGLDGSSISNVEIQDINTNFYFEKYGIRMSKHEICCALGHRMVYQYMVDKSIDKALILEDDAYPLSILPDLLNKIDSIDNYDLLYLFHGKAKKSIFYKKLPHNYRLYKYLTPSENSRRAIIYAVAYILSLNGAHKLLEVGEKIMAPADFLTGLIQLHNLRTFGVEPCCVDHGAFKTSITDR